jgi:hypothetical protein
MLKILLDCRVLPYVLRARRAHPVVHGLDLPKNPNLDVLYLASGMLLEAISTEMESSLCSICGERSSMSGN